MKERERAATEREQQLEELDGRNAEREKGLGRRAAKLAVSETQLANKLRDVREAEERIPVLEERALRLDERARELERVASELDERGHGSPKRLRVSRRAKRKPRSRSSVPLRKSGVCRSVNRSSKTGRRGSTIATAGSARPTTR